MAAIENKPAGAIIVLGMHRSGTSALTRGLSALGVSLGDNLKPPVSGDNDKGFFEDWALSAINDEVLDLDHCRWDSLLVPTAENAAQLNKLKLKAIAAIEAEFGESRYFAFKDPRTCRTLPFWKDVLDREGLRTFYIIAFRNPMAVASSLEARDKFPRIRSHYLWLLHTLNAVRLTEGERRVFVEYDDLIADPKSVLTRIRDLIGDPELELLPKELLAYEAGFLEEGARHHFFKPSHLGLDSACPPLVRGVYDMLRKEKVGETGSNNWARAYDAFDVIASFSELPDRLDRLAADSDRRLSQLACDTEELQARCARDGDALVALSAEVAALRTEVQEARSVNDVAEIAARQQLDELENTRRELAAAREGARKTEAELQRVVTGAIELREQHEHALQAAVKERSTIAAALEEAVRRESIARENGIQAREDLSRRLSATQQRAAASEARSEQADLRGQQIASDYERSAAQLAASLANNAALRVAVDELFHQLETVHQSTSWRATRLIRVLKRTLTGRNEREWAPYRPFVPELDDVQPPPSLRRADAVMQTAKPPTIAFFTICSRNFLAFARTLHDSLIEQYGSVQFYVALCDAPEAPFIASEHPFSFVYLDDLDLPQWREMAQRYNITEFNTAIKPFVFQHLMRRNAADYIVYIDPDIIVKSRLIELEKAFASGVSAVLTPHVTGPAENVEVSDIKMLQYGIYNLGFAAFKNSPEALPVVEWWGRRLFKDCVIKLEHGLFVDQKWADLFPSFLDDLHVLRHPGYNVAYWNVAQRRVERTAQGDYLVNNVPLRFAHFSGSDLDDPSTYSRHSSQFNTTNIGDLSKLLDEYRARVFANGHENYRRIPYAFSWNGAGGVNLHTPMPENQVKRERESAPPSASASIGALALAQTAAEMAGGLPQLAMKAARALRAGGIDALREGVERVHQTALQRAVNGTAAAPREGGRVTLHQSKKLLFIDWSTPRPDRDAGSVTAFHLMGMLVRLGFEVTFIPSDLEYLGAYTESVRRLGVRCLHRNEVGTIKKHLELEGEHYDFALMCRAPIATHYIDDIRRHAGRAKIILNTSDLHYLRDIREAELSGDRSKIEAARVAKNWELDVIQRCDVTIVMSQVEKDILAVELPTSDIRLLPLMFVEPADDVPPFSARKDIIFIGGFPHQPNVDAALYFAREIFPRIRARLPDVTWHVVGNSPPPEVIALNDIEGIRVHGFVKDITPLFRSARLSVAPLRYGAGIKGKLGTSLGYGVPGVVTTIAAEGMLLKDGKEIRIADDPQSFADAVVALYEDESAWTAMSANGRRTMWEEYSVAAGQKRIGALMRDLAPGRLQLDVQEVRSKAQYEELQQSLKSELLARQQTELTLVRRDKPSFAVRGYCAICGGPRAFSTTFEYAFDDPNGGGLIPNWREQLACERCGLPNRVRASVHLFDMLAPKGVGSIYLTEQLTPLFALMKERFGDRVTGSEYLGAVCALGETHEGVRNEDLTRLSFADEFFDHVLSFDVLEHVSDDAFQHSGIRSLEFT